MKSVFQWNTKHTLVMGILNVTPDSFSDGGRYAAVDAAVMKAKAMVEAGADMIDVGGESTRPGAKPVSVEEELNRVIPVVEKLAQFAVSVDTMKAEVAEKALAAGARIVNDVSALRADERMAEVICNSGAGVVLMHMRGTPQSMQENPQYTDVVTEVREFLAERIRFAESRGIRKSQIAVDPGIGFGKTVGQNLRLLKEMGALQDFGCPVVVGTSRKSFIGKLLGRETHERQWGTAATVAWTVARGARIVRVHDVAEMRDVVRMVEFIQTAQETE